MADYKTHLTVSGATGIGYGLAATLIGGFTPVQGTLAGCLTGIAGMLPDVDSESGRPVREIFGVLAAISPMIMMGRLQAWAGHDPEAAMLLGVLVYVTIRYGASTLLGLLAVHRGMYHSLPAMLIAGELTFLGYASDSMAVKFLMGFGVVLGFASHLVLDEIYSVQWSGTRLKLKSSAGSAVKFFGKHWGVNIFVYGLLFTATYAAIVDGGRTRAGSVPQPTDTLQAAPDPLPKPTRPTRR